MSWIAEHLDLVLKVLGGVASAITALVTWITSRTRLRVRLKTDIEILKSLDANHSQRPLIETRVTETIRHVYGATPVSFQYRSFAGVLGALMAIGFVWWSVTIILDEPVSNWWVIATGYGAMLGLSLIFWSLGMYDRAERGKDSASTEASRQE